MLAVFRVDLGKGEAGLVEERLTDLFKTLTVEVDFHFRAALAAAGIDEVEDG